MERMDNFMKVNSYTINPGNSLVTLNGKLALIGKNNIIIILWDSDLLIWHLISFSIYRTSE